MDFVFRCGTCGKIILSNVEVRECHICKETNIRYLGSTEEFLARVGYK